MSKGLPFEAIMLLTEQQITEGFPHGARVQGTRWHPADSPEQAAKTLKQLLRDKKGRQHKDSYMNRSYSRDNYTDIRHYALCGEDAPVVPKDVQKQYSDKAREDFVKAELPLSERVKSLEGKLRREQMASLRRRVEALERTLQDKAA